VEARFETSFGEGVTLTTIATALEITFSNMGERNFL